MKLFKGRVVYSVYLTVEAENKDKASQIACEYANKVFDSSVVELEIDELKEVSKRKVKNSFVITDKNLTKKGGSNGHKNHGRIG